MKRRLLKPIRRLIRPLFGCTHACLFLCPPFILKFQASGRPIKWLNITLEASELPTQLRPSTRSGRWLQWGYSLIPHRWGDSSLNWQERCDSNWKQRRRGKHRWQMLCAGPSRVRFGEPWLRHQKGRIFELACCELLRNIHITEAHTGTCFFLATVRFLWLTWITDVLAINSDDRECNTNAQLTFWFVFFFLSHRVYFTCILISIKAYDEVWLKVRYFLLMSACSRARHKFQPLIAG